MLGPLKLTHEHLHVVPVWGKALSARRGQVDVGANHGAKVILKGAAESPDCWVEGLRVEHPDAAAIVVKIPENRGKDPASGIVSLPLAIGVRGHVEVLPKDHLCSLRILSRALVEKRDL